MASPRAPGQRAGLTRTGVLAAAQAIRAEHGIETVTMRALARRLGVSPNALYSHIPDKAALVDDLLDDALGAVIVSESHTDDPVAGVHAIMSATYEALLTHADLIPLYLERQGARGPNAQRLGEIVLALLARSGQTEPRALAALHVLIVYTIGSAAFATSSPIPTRKKTAHATVRFENGLRWLLTGITDELIDVATPPNRRPRRHAKPPRAPSSASPNASQ